MLPIMNVRNHKTVLGLERVLPAPPSLLRDMHDLKIKTEYSDGTIKTVSRISSTSKECMN